MKHIFLVDPIEKLNIKKDSSLYLACRFSESRDVYITYFENLVISNYQKTMSLEVFSFSHKFNEDGFYIKEFSIKEQFKIELGDDVCIHMRLDPPYDEKYHRVLWKLDYLRNQSSCKVVNDPFAIMQVNEKLSCFHLPHSVPSEIIPSVSALKEKLFDYYGEKKYQSVIAKPLNSFSGFGVHKIDLSKFATREEFESHFNQVASKIDYEDIILQPYIEMVEEGELRIICMGDEHLGSIIKTPPKGDFLSNIAQGATFESIQPPQDILDRALGLSRELYQQGLFLIAFDVLGEAITEMNVTCPGLLVETDFANQKDSSGKILKIIESL